MSAPATPVPLRARLADALACVTGGACPKCVSDMRREGFRDPAWCTIGVAPPITDPAEAWETFATRGLIPAAWVDDPRRRFDAECPRCHGRGRVPEYDRHARAYVSRGGRQAHDPCPVCPLKSPRHRTCTGRVALARPATLADCVAFAADAPNVLAAEALAREHVARRGANLAAAAAAGVTPAALHRMQPRPDVVAWRVAPLPPLGVSAGACARELRALGYALTEIDARAVTLVCPGL